MNKPETSSEHLYELLKDFHSAMLVSRSSAGDMHARPMAVAELRAGADAYFVTGIDSPKVAEIKANPVVMLIFQSAYQFASVHGRVSVVRDQALVDRLWQEAWKVWFPQGKTDPAIALLKFEAEQGEYWDNSGVQGLKYAFQAIKAYAKGEKLKPDDAAQHAKISL
jgi:general stress protein 26